MKYKSIDEVKPSPVLYMTADLFIRDGWDKECTCESYGIPVTDYNQNIRMIRREWKTWPGKVELIDPMPDASRLSRR